MLASVLVDSAQTPPEAGPSKPRSVPSPTSAETPGESSAASTVHCGAAAARDARRGHGKKHVATEKRTQLGKLRCRPPPLPPPAPPPHAAALPFLLARHPRLPLISPGTKNSTNRARIRSRSLSVTPVPDTPPVPDSVTSVSGDDGPSASDELEARWADLWPAVADQPHLASSDTELVDDTDRRFRSSRNPNNFHVRSFEPDLAKRPFQPWTLTRSCMYPMDPRPSLQTLPDPYDRGPMRRAEAAEVSDKALLAAQRSARKRRRNASPSTADSQARRQRAVKSDASRRAQENDVLRRLIRSEGNQDNAAGSDSDSDYVLSDDDNRSTLGFMAVARRVLRTNRQERRRPGTTK